jgi:hypothetical protein
MRRYGQDLTVMIESFCENGNEHCVEYQVQLSDTKFFRKVTILCSYLGAHTHSTYTFVLMRL